MPVARTSGTPLFTGSFVLDEHTTHESVNVDNNAVVLDADADHLIRITHTRNDSKDILAAVDRISGTKSAFIDSAGDLHCPNLLYGNPERSVGTDIGLLVTNIDLIETDISANQTTI